MTYTQASVHHDRLSSIHNSVRKAIDILEATDESVVARKSAEIIRYYLREFEERDRDRDRGYPLDEGHGAATAGGGGMLHGPTSEGPVIPPGFPSANGDDALNAGYGHAMDESGDGLGIPVSHLPVSSLPSSLPVNSDEV
jgi:hypothetical protein